MVTYQPALSLFEWNSALLLLYSYRSLNRRSVKQQLIQLFVAAEMLGGWNLRQAIRLRFTWGHTMVNWREIRESADISATTMQKWGGLASFILAITFIIPPWIYLTGNVRATTGLFAYALADLLSGPVRAASLIVALVVLRDRLSERAPRRMSLALLAALIAAGTIVGVACIRSTNRQYLLSHPELSDTLSTTLLTAWGTIVTGLNAAGWHFLGWAFVLSGVAGWTSRRFSRGLSALYFATGAISLFVYVLPDSEGLVVALSMVVGIWQSIILWKVEPGETQVPGIKISQPDRT